MGGTDADAGGGVAARDGKGLSNAGTKSNALPLRMRTLIWAAESIRISVNFSMGTFATAPSNRPMRRSRPERRLQTMTARIADREVFLARAGHARRQGRRSRHPPA